MKIPAKGITGFLIREFNSNKVLFRVYNYTNSTFVDYDITCDCIDITINDEDIDLIQTEKRNYIDWNDRVLGVKDENSDA